jgi:hypothetical protein
MRKSAMMTFPGYSISATTGGYSTFLKLMKNENVKQKNYIPEQFMNDLSRSMIKPGKTKSYNIIKTSFEPRDLLAGYLIAESHVVERIS